MAAPRKSAPAQLRPTSVEEWKSDTQPYLPLPSGKVIEARNPGLRAFLKAGVVPNDLMRIIQEALDKGAQPDMSKIMGPDGQPDPKMVEQMFHMMDVVFCEVAIAPRVHPKPAKPEDRKKDRIYVDEVSDEDKQFVFGWVSGGTRDVETFREELRKGVDALSGGEGPRVPAKRAPRARSKKTA